MTMTISQSAARAVDVGLEPGTWRPVPDSGYVGFEVRTMWGLATVRGRFDRYDGALVVGADELSAELTVETDSVNTAKAKRDAHLRSADFFDSERYPAITFRSRAVTVGPTGLLIDGELTIGETTLRRVLEADLIRDEAGVVVLSTETTVDRSEAKLDWNWFGIIVGDALLTVELELERQAQ
jgi:polyisoprenoid-binding protein YceI